MRAFSGYKTIALLMLTTASLSAQKAGISLENQASTWFGMNFPEEVAWQAGA
ncbi:MAG: hypothetical protein U5L72_03740 [Bacteroidales bacterium]|nr:hypothetical protein [Bacteroidales bacterium]